MNVILLYFSANCSVVNTEIERIRQVNFTRKISKKNVCIYCFSLSSFLTWGIFYFTGDEDLVAGKGYSCKPTYKIRPSCCFSYLAYRADSTHHLWTQISKQDLNTDRGKDVFKAFNSHKLESSLLVLASWYSHYLH